MSLLAPLINDLREKRLWPVVMVLVGALVAVPVLLAKPAPKPHLQAALSGPAAAGSSSGVPVVSISGSVVRAPLHAHARDPFKQQHSSNTGSSPTSTSTPGGGSTISPSGSSGTGTGSGAAAGTGGSGGTSTTGTTPSSTPANPGLPSPIPIPDKRPKPAPSGLSADQSYAVTVAITSSSGGLNTFDPLERLSVLPSRRQPMLVELGVLRGGRRVLFVVRPGTVLRGPGKCLPGPIDCQIMSLGTNQVEGLLVKTRTSVTSVGLFAVTGIKAERHRTLAAAKQARRQVSSLGQRLLRGSKLNALPLFPYSPGIGAIVDRRNLQGGLS